MSQRVLFINNVGQIGGAERSLLILVAGLKMKGWHPLVVCPPNSMLAQQVSKEGSLVHPVSLTDSVRHAPSQYVKALGALAQLAARWKPSLIHCNGVRSCLYGVPIGRLFRIPVIAHVRDIDLPPSPITRRLIAMADRQIAISKAVQAVLLKEGIEHHSIVVYNGVNIAHFQKNCSVLIRQQFQIPLEKFVIGLIGRILPWKGHETFIRIAALLRHRSDLIWLIIGDEWDRSAGFQQRLVQLARDANINDRVIFTGWQDDVAAFISALDVVVVPSLQAEPFGRVVIEAMAGRRPVVASRIGGLAEIIENEQTGCLAEPGDATAFAAHIQRLRDDQSFYQSIVVRGWEAVSQRFSHEHHVTQIVNIYQSLI